MAKILITGATSRAASRVGESELWQAYGLELVAPTHSELDVTQPANVESNIAALQPDVVINFAAITDLKQCEAERNNQHGLVWQANVAATHHLAQLATTYHFHLIQISTASVFAGEPTNPGPYPETAAPEIDHDKLSWYGVTKLLAEQSVQATAEAWSIVRLASTVRASAQSKPCLFRRWLSQYQAGGLPPLFDDEQLTLTDLTDLDVALAKLSKDRLVGIYHVTSQDLTTPYQLAEKLLTYDSHRTSPGRILELKRASLAEAIANGDKQLQRFCPLVWGLDATATSQKLGLTFNTIPQSLAEFFHTDQPI
jgi:dTDP-4-dehydrorhamnose reductase